MVTADQYPYIASSTSLGAMVVPQRYRTGDRFKEALKDEESAAKLRASIATRYPPAAKRSTSAEPVPGPTPVIRQTFFVDINSPNNPGSGLDAENAGVRRNTAKQNSGEVRGDQAVDTDFLL